MPAPSTRHLTQLLQLTAPAVSSPAPSVAQTKPPIGLSVVVDQPDGRSYRWDSASKAGDVPQGIGFRTKRGDGFGDGSVTLSRRIDRDYPDLKLYDTVSFIGADGSIAYESRLAANPRSMGDTHTMTAQLAGWMSHLKDRKFTEIFADRDLASWGPVSRARRAELFAGTAGFLFNPTDSTVVSDTTSGLPALELKFDGAWVSPYKPSALALYDAGAGNKIAAVYYDFVSTGFGANWIQTLEVRSTDDRTGAISTSGNVSAASAQAYYTPTTPNRFAEWWFYYDVTPSGSDGAFFHSTVRNLTVYGAHGLLRRGADPGGLAASDVIRDIVRRFGPKLNVGGVRATTYPIPHLVFKEPTFPYDALLEINKYHLWELAVWENRTLYFEPPDLTTYDWQVHLSDPGVQVDLQGDSTDQLANGIVVTYTDVATGTKNRLMPTDHTELQDRARENPANRAGMDVWTELNLSSPTTAEAALQIGRAALAEFNQPKAVGTIKVTGHIRDAAGHWQPVWKVRAGDTVAITDSVSLSDRPRMIVETDYSHPGQLSIAVDSTFLRVDAIMDRFGTALAAAGLN